jgi:quercetin dioxygenase-like cupin family protein
MIVFRLLVAAALAASAADSPKSFTTNAAKVPWAPIKPPGAPAGLIQRVLHDQKDKQLVSAIVRFPKGYTEPRHYHTQCGHSIYVLKGRLKAPDGVWTAGSFNYAAVNEPHGPFTAIEETDILFYTDGPFDYHVTK